MRFLSRRDDTDFWRDGRRAESAPERLTELLALWKFQPPSRYDLHRCFREAAQPTRRMLGALSSNRDLIEHIRKSGLLRI